MGQEDSCHDKEGMAYHLWVAVMVTAASIIILLNFTQVTTDCWKRFLFGIPRFVIPVNLLGPSPFRLIYCVILGSWGADVLQMVADQSLYYRSGYSLLDAIDFFVLSPTVIILKQALAYFPVFACVDAPIPVLSHCIGFLYTCLMVSSNAYSEYAIVKGCSYRGELSNRDIGLMLGSRAPVYILYLVIISWFLIRTMLNALRMAFVGHRITQKTPDEYKVCTQYVKNLLKKQRQTGSFSNQIVQHSLWNYLIRGLDYVLPSISQFYYRYPLPILGSFVMAYAVIVPMVISLSGREFILAQKLLHWLEGFSITVHIIEDIFPSTKHHLDRVFQDVLSFAKAYEIILPLGSVIGFGLCGLFTAYMVQNTHKHFMGAARGDTRFLVRSEPLPSLAYRLAATMRYTAFQVAYLVFCWMLYSFMLWSLFSVGLLFYYLFKDKRHFAIHLWSWFMVPMIWGAAIYNLQLFLCKYVFLKTQRGKLPLMRLQWLYQILTYFFFFYNVIFGFVMCFLRVFGVLIFTVVMLFRLDWDVYMRGLEGWDTGHRTYISYVYTEYTYHNVVMRLFVHLLLKAVKTSPSSRPRRQERSWSLERDMYGTENGTGLRGPDMDAYSTPQVASRRARNRWLLAFTLLRNPCLLEDRVREYHSIPAASMAYTIN